MATTRKTSETAAILRAGRAKPASHNSAAKKTVRAKPGAGVKRERIMINVPPEQVPSVKAHAAALGISMSTYYVMAANEKLARGDA